MDELDEEKILNNANRRIRKTALRDEQDHTDPDTAPGSGSETSGRDTDNGTRSLDETRGFDWGIQKVEPLIRESTRRGRKPIGRSGENHGSPDDSLSESETTEPRIGGFHRLEADEKLPPRPAASFDSIDHILLRDPKISDYKLAKALGCSKSEAKKRRAEWLSKGSLPEPEPEKTPSFIKSMKTLSKQEAEAIYEPLLEAIESDFQAIDMWLWARQEAKGIDHHGKPVWSDFDEEEAAKLGKLLCKWGQKNAVVATGVRGLVEAGDYVAVASMFVPRIKKTVEIYRETKTERKSRYANFARRERIPDKPEAD